ncbi:hypothetical protein FQZ97_694830 [compost metagenome]
MTVLSAGQLFEGSQRAPDWMNDGTWTCGDSGLPGSASERKPSISPLWPAKSFSSSAAHFCSFSCCRIAHWMASPSQAMACSHCRPEALDSLSSSSCSSLALSSWDLPSLSLQPGPVQVEDSLPLLPSALVWLTEVLLVTLVVQALVPEQLVVVVVSLVVVVLEPSGLVTSVISFSVSVFCCEGDGLLGMHTVSPLTWPRSHEPGLVYSLLVWQVICTRPSPSVTLSVQLDSDLDCASREDGPLLGLSSALQDTPLPL